MKSEILINKSSYLEIKAYYYLTKTNLLIFKLLRKIYFLIAVVHSHRSNLAMLYAYVLKNKEKKNILCRHSAVWSKQQLCQLKT